MSADEEGILTDTDNLSFYHKVLLPGLLLVLVGMVGAQAYLMVAVTRLETKMGIIEQAASDRYTAKDAKADWKLQELKDAQLLLKLNGFEERLKNLEKL